MAACWARRQAIRQPPIAARTLSPAHLQGIGMTGRQIEVRATVLQREATSFGDGFVWVLVSTYPPQQYEPRVVPPVPKPVAILERHCSGGRHENSPA